MVLIVELRDSARDEMADVDTREIVGVTLGDVEVDDAMPSSSSSRRCATRSVRCISATISFSVSSSVALDRGIVVDVDVPLRDGVTCRRLGPDCDLGVLGKLICRVSTSTVGQGYASSIRSTQSSTMSWAWS